MRGTNYQPSEQAPMPPAYTQLGAEDQAELSQLAALLAAVPPDEPVLFSQDHKTWNGVDGRAACTGWVDVVIHGVTSRLWSVTLSGDWEAALRDANDLVQIGERYGETALLLDRSCPWVMWADHDTALFRLLFADAFRGEAQAADQAPGEQALGEQILGERAFRAAQQRNHYTVDPSGVHIAVAHGRTPSAADLLWLARASQRLAAGDDVFAVLPAWSIGQVEQAVSDWAYAWTGIRRAFAYVAPQPSRPTPLVAKLQQRSSGRQAESARVAALRADPDREQVGGYPTGEAWLSLPACNWAEEDDDALYGEVRSRCLLPSSYVGVLTAGQTDAGLLERVHDGHGEFPTGIPSCKTHLPQLRQLPVHVVADPSRRGELVDEA